MCVQLLVQPLTGRDFERSAISHKLYDIARAIQNRTAMSTILKMSCHDVAETWLYFIVNVIGNLPPNLYAVNFDGPFRQVVPPFPSSIQVGPQECGTGTLPKPPVCLTQQLRKRDKKILKLARQSLFSIRISGLAKAAQLSSVFPS